MTTVWELYVTNLGMGLAGAANESLVMITVSIIYQHINLDNKHHLISDTQVADLFFVHQRGTMNGIYIAVVILGV
jgi:hypothetical protein